MANTCAITTLRIKKTTRNLIDSVGLRGESFDDIIQRVFQECASSSSNRNNKQVVKVSH
jgi:hypothetical protein